MLLISALIVLSAFVTSCDTIGTINDGDDSQKKIEEDNILVKDELNIPLIGPETLDPLKNNDLLYYYFEKLIYQSLFEFDGDFEPTLFNIYRGIEKYNKTGN